LGVRNLQSLCAAIITVFLLSTAALAQEGASATQGRKRYTITGKITSAGKPLRGVSVSAGPRGNSATTNARGRFRITDLSRGSYQVKPAKRGYRFVRASRRVSVGPNATGANFVGILQNDGLVANAGPDQTTEQTSAAGAEVTLDGTGSEGALDYVWYDDGTPLGPGPVITVTLSLGVHTITLEVMDEQGNSASDEATVTVEDTTAPDLTAPNDTGAEQISADGTPVLLGDPVVDDLCDADVEVTNDAPAVFPLGETTVTWTATDDSGNVATAEQVVTIVDTTPPTIIAPADTGAEQTSADGTPVSLGDPIVEDICDSDVEVTNDAPAAFPLGETTVTWTATDDSGNAATAEQVVTVVDTTPPTIIAPDDTGAEQVSADGTPVALGDPTVEDICDAEVEVTNDAPAVFPLGETTVTWTATDDSGNVATAEQLVTVVDTTPPTIVAPDDITAEQTSADGTPVALGDPTVEDICDAEVEVTNDAPAVFPLGQTTVTWTATDDSGNAATDEQVVTIVDTTPPDLDLTVLKAELWPPNHKMVLAATATVIDICDTDVDVTIEVTSNEPIDGIGDGNTEPDWDVIRAGNVWAIRLRAERAGPSSGREYHIDVTATDGSGNVSAADATVIVPHDKSKTQ